MNYKKVITDEVKSDLDYFQFFDTMMLIDSFPSLKVLLCNLFFKS